MISGRGREAHEPKQLRKAVCGCPTAPCRVRALRRRVGRHQSALQFRGSSP
jgi:hypothetical protein